MTSAWDPWPSPRSNPGSPRLMPMSHSLSRSPTKEGRSPISGFSPADRSWMLSARITPPPPPNLPILPPEILRRIIRHALALPPSIPAPFPNIDAAEAAAEPDAQWNAFGARAARKGLDQRGAHRASVMRTALSFMAVCRAWKQLALSSLYAEPHIHGENITALAHALLQGDRKWSDINLHPHSTPGRWITVLDLSGTQDPSYLGADAVTTARACAALLDLAPNVVHLRLPAQGVRLDDLRFAPCVGRLRALEGVHLASEADEEDAIKLIRAAKRLEFLGLVWVGAEPDAPDMDADYSEAKQLVLPNLHTVTLVAGRPGPLLAALTRADLPVLSRFVTSPYEPGLAAFDADADRGGPRAFQVAHGGVIRSLTYVSTPGWPRRDLVPPADTLALHPNLVHLHLAIPHTLLNEHPELGAALQSSTHPLAVLALPRWPKVMYGADTSPAPTPAMTPGVQGQPPGFPPTPPPEWGGPPPPGRHAFLTALVPLTRVKTIVVDGFTWVQPALGRWAAESGDSGVMRQWANWLVRRGIELCDQEGNVAPVIERGRGSFSSTSGFRPPIMGRKSVDGGRRSFDSGWPR